MLTGRKLRGAWRAPWRAEGDGCRARRSGRLVRPTTFTSELAQGRSRAFRRLGGSRLAAGKPEPGGTQVMLSGL